MGKDGVSVYIYVHSERAWGRGFSERSERIELDNGGRDRGVVMLFRL